ncbi:MAG: sugar transferase [Ardenticatenales bacterium]|nr:sugar transferase [Ardenticatenales bacterium]
MEINRHTIYQQNPWLAQIEPSNRLLRGRSYLVAKRIMDLTLVMLSLPLMLPLFLLCILAIKIESPRDPVFFIQKRTGKGGTLFGMYKFRTMVVNAEEMKKELMHLNELQWPDFKISKDPRITRIGRFLRKSSLDELPQLLNVITGDMSLVGPRPTSFKPETYQLWQTERLDVQPGLTGLWQILGRSSTEFDERLRLDVAYIERRCLWLDMEILLRTVLAVFQGRGAR